MTPTREELLAELTDHTFSNAGDMADRILALIASKREQAVKSAEEVLITKDLLPRLGFITIPLGESTSYLGRADLNFGNPVLYLNRVHYLSLNAKTPNGVIWFQGFPIKCNYLSDLQRIYSILTDKLLQLDGKPLLAMLEYAEQGKEWYELQKCECDHTVPIQFAVSNDEGCYTCMPCHIKYLNGLLDEQGKGDNEQQYEELAKEIGEMTDEEFAKNCRRLHTPAQQNPAPSDEEIEEEVNDICGPDQDVARKFFKRGAEWRRNKTRG